MRKLIDSKWYETYRAHAFTSAERAVGVALASGGIGLVIAGGFHDGYVQALMAEAGVGFVLFSALGLAAPRRLPRPLTAFLVLTAAVVLVGGTRIDAKYDYLQSVTADAGIALLLFVALERFASDALGSVEQGLVFLRIFSAFRWRTDSRERVQHAKEDGTVLDGSPPPRPPLSPRLYRLPQPSLASPAANSSRPAYWLPGIYRPSDPDMTPRSVRVKEGVNLAESGFSTGSDANHPQL